VIDGTSIEWRKNPKVLSYCFILYFLYGSNRSTRDSCSSGRGNRNGGRRYSPPKGPFGSLPFGGEDYCGVCAPFGTNLHQQVLHTERVGLGRAL
jgi:hypothetical protein